MSSNVVGLFETHAQADEAIRELIGIGIAPARISVIAADPAGRIQRQIVDRSGELAASGAATGATGGLIVGSLVGLLVGTATIAAPPVGILLAGPVAGLLAGAGLGIVSGGLIGAIVGLGISESDAHIYAESVRRGGTVLSVEVSDAQRAQVERDLAACGAVSVAERGAMLREEGFVEFDPNAPVYSVADEQAVEMARYRANPITTLPTQDAVSDPEYSAVEASDESLMVPNGMDTVFQQHFSASEEGVTALTYDQLRPAYRFGYEIAELPVYQNRPWTEVMPEARQAWEDRNPGTWERASSAIHFGWNCLATPTELRTAPPVRGLEGRPKVL